MKIAINEATTMNASFEEDVAAYAAAGWPAIELWLDKVKRFMEAGNSLADARKLIDDAGLEVAGACFHMGAMLTTGEERAANLDQFRAKLDMCQALGSPVLIVPTDFPAEVRAEDYDRAAEGLAEAGCISAPYGVDLAIEFIKGADLIGSLSSATALARKTGRCNVGVLLDTFHLFAGISKTEDIAAMKADELLFVHLNDARDLPREIVADKDRCWPGEGVMPIKEMLAACAAIGYDGYVSVELFDEAVWAMPCTQAAKLALEKTSDFMRKLG